MSSILSKCQRRKRPSGLSLTRIHRVTPQLIRWSVNKNLMVSGVEVKHV